MNYEYLLQSLQEKGVSLIEVSPDYYNFDFQGDQDLFTIHINFKEFDSKLMFCKATSPFDIELSQIKDFLRISNLINSKLNHGSFSVDLEDGEFSFRIGHFFTGSELTIERFNEMIDFCCYTMNKYIPVIEAALGGMDFEEALKLANQVE